MNVSTIIAVLVLALILFAAVRYIYKEKKKGNACIGCPYAASCQKHRNGASCSAPHVCGEDAEPADRKTDAAGHNA